jgi:hypothetical protein
MTCPDPASPQFQARLWAFIDDCNAGRPLPLDDPEVRWYATTLVGMFTGMTAGLYKSAHQIGREEALAAAFQLCSDQRALHESLAATPVP